MGLIENIKATLEDYKRYKNIPSSRYLTVPNVKKKSFFNFWQIENFMNKYSDIISKSFGVPIDIKDYEFLVNFFGKKKLESVLSNSSKTIAQMGEELFENELPEKDYKNPILSTMRNSIIFNKTTGLNLNDIANYNIQPDNLRRKSLENKSVLEIFEDENISKDTLKEIYDLYGKEIVAQYNEDSFLRNKTILELEGEMGGIEDHVTDYSEQDFHDIFQKYFAGEELSKKENCILMGLLAKEADLIGEYSVKYLRDKPDYIKAEIDVGIFKDIVVAGKKYTNQNRKMMALLHGTWNEVDFERYNNLELLKQRLSTLPETESSLETISKIEEILKKNINEIVAEGQEIADFMDESFLDYEVENRNQIIENVYNPEQSENVITDLSQLGSAAMLHFFNPNRVMSNFESYVEREEKKRSEELGTSFKFSEKELKNMKKQYKMKENHYITDYALDFEGVGQTGMSLQYRTNTSNQLCAMIATPEEIVKSIGIRGQVALGFSKKNLSSDLIATVSNKNIHSNKGIDYVETNNSFQDFSSSYTELIEEKRRSDANNEIVLFRNADMASLKPSYVMYIANEKLNSEKEIQGIEELKEQMKEVGLDVPLVIIDRYSILEKMKLNQISSEKKEDTSR